MKRILIIHQRQEERARLSLALERAGFQMVVAEDTEGGLEKLRETSPDIVIMAEDSSRGKELCSQMRDSSGAHLIILGRGDQLARVMMLEKGADVYLNEPVSPRELAAWVWSLLRR